MTLIVAVVTREWGVIAADGRTTDRITKEVREESATKVVRLSPRLLFATCGTMAYSSAMRDVILRTVGDFDPPPEADFQDLVAYVRTVALHAWRQDFHPEGETLGMIIVGLDSSAGCIRALSADNEHAFAWEENLEHGLHVHWMGPAGDVAETVQRWFSANETKMSGGPSFAISALREVFTQIAAQDSTVNTQITFQTVLAQGAITQDHPNPRIDGRSG